jgi:hypothetical protein
MFEFSVVVPTYNRLNFLRNEIKSITGRRDVTIQACYWSRVLTGAGHDSQEISKCKDKLRCKGIEVFASDADSFELGPDVTTIYFPNPFAETILENVLRRIMASYNENPRAARIVCNLPQEPASSASWRRRINLCLISNSIWEWIAGATFSR